MKRHATMLLLTILATGFLAQAAGAQEAKPAPMAVEPTNEVAPGPESATKVAPAPMLPRQARWARVEITYRPADVRHPTLYCDSYQEKLRHNDAAHRGPLGLAFAWAYECIQFPAQLIAGPVLVVVKPPFMMETGKP